MSGKTNYTPEQEHLLQQIADSEKETWNEKIKKVLPEMGGRSYASLWQKVYALSGHKPGDIAKSGKNRKSKLVKKAARPRGAYNHKVPVKKKGTLYKTGGGKMPRKLHKSPLRGTTMLATSNELRFPIESLRIEKGELIVTFK